MSKAEQVYYWLLGEFSAHRILEGGKLPSEYELCQQFQVSRPQVREALARLNHEGLVESIKGKGTFRKTHVSSVVTGIKDIGVVLPQLTGYIYPELVEAADSAIRTAGYQALFSCSESNLTIEAQILSRLIERKPAGLIISPFHDTPEQYSPNYPLLTRLAATGTSIVVLDHDWPPFSSIFLDDYTAGSKAAQYLYEKGHLRCGICWKQGHVPFIKRTCGFIETMQRFPGVTWDATFELCLPRDSEQAWEEPIRSFLTRPDRPTAIFCVNDHIAVCIRAVAAELGLSIPEDLSLLGFDDSPLASLPDVSLTSFSYPARFIGTKSVEFILEALEITTPSNRRTMQINPPLIERKSVLKMATS